MSTGNYWTRAARARMNRRAVLQRAGIAGAGVTGLALVGCGGDDDDTGSSSPTNAAGGPTADAGAPKQGGNYRWAWQGTPHLDMHQDSISGASQIIAAAYNRLLRFQDDAQLPEADLAVTMPEQTDETTYVFTLQEGVKFHNKPPVNGREMTAEDVVFSLERARTDDPLFVHKGDLETIDTIEAVDPKTVKITTKVPNAVLLTTLAGYQFFVLAPETIDEFGDLKTDRATIGTGPYVVDSASTDQGAKMSRHPEYWRTGQPYFDTIEQLVIGDHWSQFLAGNLEVAALAAENQIGFDSFEDALADAGVDAYTYEVLSYGSAQSHFMNNGAAPFDDIRVRQALNLIMDRTPQLTYGWPIGSMPSVILGYAHAQAGFGLPESEYDNMPGYRADRDKDIADGLALLAEAGYTKDNPLRFEIMGWSVPHRTIGIDNLQVAQEMYRQVSGGVIEPTVKGLEWGVWKQAEARHEFQMISSAYSMGVDAHDALVKMYHSEGGRNFAQYRDPDFDEMLLKEQAEFDLEARKGMVQDMLRYLNDPSRIANIWTGAGPAPTASIARIKGRGPLFDGGKVDSIWLA